MASFFKEKIVNLNKEIEFSVGRFNINHYNIISENNNVCFFL